MRGLRGTPLLVASATLTALGFLLVGYDIGVLGGLIANESFQKSFDYPSARLIGTIVAILEVGCFTGSLLTSIFGERLGRTTSTALGGFVMLIGAVIQAMSVNVGTMIAGRVIGGIGLGIINSTVPVLQAEISPKATRGLFVCIQLTVLNLGTMVAYWIDYAFSTSRGITGSAQWRVPLALQLVFILPLLFLSLFVVPESPRWLAAHERVPEAKAVLERLSFPISEGHEGEIDKVMTTITDTVKFDEQFGSGRWRDVWRLFKHEDAIRSRRRLFIACAIQGFQQLGGVNAVVYYASFLFSQIGFSTRQSNLISGGLFTWYFVVSFVPWALIDTAGRRKLLIICVSLMSLVFCVQSGLISRIEKEANYPIAIAACAMIFLFMGFFTIGFQAVVWVYPSEILPLRLRAKGSALSTATNWICNYLVVQVTPTLITEIGYKTYIIFAALNASFIPVIYLTFPETKGLSLEEIDELFSSSRERLDETDSRTGIL